MKTKNATKSEKDMDQLTALYDHLQHEGFYCSEEVQREVAEVVGHARNTIQNIYRRLKEAIR